MNAKRDFFPLFCSPDDVQSIISGKLALRYSGSQVHCIDRIHKWRPKIFFVLIRPTSLVSTDKMQKNVTLERGYSASWSDLHINKITMGICIGELLKIL